MTRNLKTICLLILGLTSLTLANCNRKKESVAIEPPPATNTRDGTGTPGGPSGGGTPSDGQVEATINIPLKFASESTPAGLALLDLTCDGNFIRSTDAVSEINPGLVEVSISGSLPVSDPLLNCSSIQLIDGDNMVYTASLAITQDISVDSYVVSEQASLDEGKKNTTPGGGETETGTGGGGSSAGGDASVSIEPTIKKK